MEKEKQLSVFIQKNKIQAAIKLLKSKEGNSFNREYEDVITGNTYFHYIVNSIISNISKYYQNPEDEELEYDFHIQLLEEFLNRKFIYGINTKTKKIPHVILKEYLDDPKITDWSHITSVNRIHSLIIEKVEKAGLPLYSGKKYVSEFNLIRRSKRKTRNPCLIEDSWEDMDKEDKLPLSLHQRLSLYEKYIDEKLDDKEAKNRVIANIGFVISDRAILIKRYKDKNRSHNRIFLTHPITDDKNMFIGKKDIGHSEDNLVEFLKNNIESIIKKLTISYKKNNEKGYKIYGVVLDIHSSREVCEFCTEKLINKLQLDESDVGFPKLLKRYLKDHSFLTPVKSPLPIVIRASGIKFSSTVKSIKDKKWNYFPQVKESYDHDIRALHGVILHLPPTGAVIAREETLNSENIKLLKEMRKERLDANQQCTDDIYDALKEVGFFVIHKQTAFLNSSNKERTQEWEDTNMPGTKQINEIKDISILMHSMKI